MRKATRLGSLGAALLVIGFITWGWTTDETNGWWGAVGQWLGALGSLIAAAVALWIADRSWRLAESDRRESQKVQARLVFGEFYPGRGISGSVQIANRSGGFLLDPCIESISVETQYGPGAWYTGRAGEGNNYNFPHKVAAVLAALTPTDSISVFYSRSGTGTSDASDRDIDPVVTISFVDSDGRSWERRGRDEPQRTYSRKGMRDNSQPNFNELEPPAPNRKPLTWLRAFWRWLLDKEERPTGHQ